MIYKRDAHPALNDSLPTAHSLLSIVYAQKQQYDQAIAEGERAIALDPNNADSYAWQAQVLNFAGRPEEALQVGGAGDAAQPPLSALVLIRIGRGLQHDRALCRGDRHAEGSHQPEPQFSAMPTLIWLSATWSSGLAQQSPDAQTLEPAVAAGQRALALNDSLHWNHIVLGRSISSNSSMSQALAEMERAVALAPTVAGAMRLWRRC